MKILNLIIRTSVSLRHITLAAALGALFMPGQSSAQTTLANGATQDITGDPLANFFAAAGAVTMEDGSTIQCSPDQNSSPAGSANAGWNFDNEIIFGGNSGTINLKFNDNDTYWNFNGQITATASGAQTLAITTGYGGNGDREAVNFTTSIPDGSSGAIGLQIAHNVQSAGNTYVNLIAVNTFTGPITVTAASNVGTGYLVVGGERYERGFDGNSPYMFAGSGSLGSGNYPGTISLGARTALDYFSSAAQTLSGVISGAGAVQVSGSGTLTLSGLNTYSGNTIVNSGTLALDAAGALSCVVTNATASKITGGGIANLDGTLSIDTSAVTLAMGSWTLVDVATPNYGSSFSVTGFTGSAGVWTKLDGVKTWTFDTATGKLSVSGPALLTSFTILGYPGVIDNTAMTVALSIPVGSDVTSLVPTYHVSSGSGSPASDTPNNFTSPATYTITDGATANAYTVTVSFFAGLNVKTYTGQTGASLLAPISNLLGLTPSATGVQVDNIEYHGGTFTALPGSPGPDNFSVLWEGWFDVLAAGGHGDYTFGTSSDDGSAIYLDLDGNGSFADADEYIVNNNYSQGDTARMGTVTLNTDSVHIVIGYYQGGGGYDMRAGWKMGTGYNFSDLALVNGMSGVFFATDPHPPVAEILTFGIPKHNGVIDKTARTISLHVPYGTDLSTLAPTYTLTTGTCNPGNGSAPSPSFAIQNPATYTVTDAAASVTNTYAVTVTVGGPPAGPPPVSDYARHFDASLLDLADGDSVTQWNDGSVNAANATVPAGHVNPTFVANGGMENELPAVHFTPGGGGSGALQFAEDTNIRSVFSVFKGASFLLTDIKSGQYHFHRYQGNDTDPAANIWDGSTSNNWASGNITGGTTYVDGVTKNWSTNPMPTNVHNGFNVVELLTTGAVIADSFNADRGGDHTGDQYQAEVLIYDRVLTESERVETEHYLMSKWFGVDYSGQITSIGIPGSSYSIDPAAMTIALTVPYGTNLVTLAPTVTVTSGTCSPASGTAPSPSFEVQNPAIYTVNDAAKGITSEYTVTVTVTPAATGAALLDVAAAGGGYAWPTDSTGLNLELVVPSSATLSAVGPTFSLSPFATCSPPSGTVRDFTSPQNYTVTAQDGTTQTYSLTLRKITTVSTGYQELVLASAPVSYWPLNEATGATTALDIASGLNNITYGGTYTLGEAGLRSDGDPSVLFNGGGSTGVAFNPSLNPTQFSVECWVKPTDSTVQYLVALQDRTTGSRTGYAIWKNNGGGAGFGMQWTSSGTNNPIINATSAAVAGSSYHVVGTYDGTTFKLYVNGVLEGSAVSTYVPASPTQPGFTIGSRNGITTAPSYIQDVALYSRALTPAEILSHYNNAPATLSYADWATAHGIGGQPASGDADGDGMSNFQEYAFGLDPTSGKSVNPISVPFSKATGTFSYTRTVNTGLTYTVWHSADLETWTSTGATQGTAVDDGGGVETVPVTLDASLLSAPKLFVRVQAQ